MRIYWNVNAASIWLFTNQIALNKFMPIELELLAGKIGKDVLNIGDKLPPE